MRLSPALACIALATAAASPLSAQVRINEIRIDQSGADVDEFFELAGWPGTSLAGLTYLVLGDGAFGSGVIEQVTPLTGNVIPPSGFFVAAESTFTLGAADLTTSLNFENDDNVTHLLVSGFTGALDDDLDTNDDGILDVTPWTAVVDRIAVIQEDNPPSSTEYHYGPPVVGPDLGFVPGGAYRFPDGAAGLSSWNIGDVDDPSLTGTPGAPNLGGEILIDAGGIQTLVVDVGPTYAGDLYLVATNFTGTAPGLTVGGVAIPLNFDILLQLSLESANGAIFVNNVGTLDSDGRAFAALHVPVLPANYAGLTLNSAAVIVDPAAMAPTLATNPVPLTLAP
ncbi:MAG TPA: hypothetical protein VKF62_00665 [Planctomycetota bacterium]|nr:hypothetical protein [Planctomycetota bacterium]